MKHDVPDIEYGSAFQVEVAGQEGIASDISGTLHGDAFSGRITIVQPDSGPTLFALALAMDPPVGNGWEAEGAVIFSAVFDSIQFFEPDAQSSSCAVSTDPTYGFEQPNPVKVGGDAFGGPARERAYLDVLLGPNGEPIAYERSGSIPLARRSSTLIR